jgi:hypothetical protein
LRVLHRVLPLFQILRARVHVAAYRNKRLESDEAVWLAARKLEARAGPFVEAA